MATFSIGGSDTGYTGNTGNAGAGSSPYANPYTNQQADALTGMVNQNLSQNILTGIRSSALANGSYGGSRQGIAEGVAAGNASTGLANSLANLFSGNYQFDVNAGLNQQSINNNATSANQNFYTNQRGQDLQQYLYGNQLYNSGVTGNANLANGMYQTGQTGMNAPLTALQQYGSTISPYTGLGQSSTSTQSGSALAGALGGYTVGGTLGNNLANLWGGTSNNSANVKGYGSLLGSFFGGTRGSGD